jgi:hypothetical protein
MFCYLPGPGGKAHAAFGMVKFFNAVDQNNVARQPPAIATATLNDFNFALPRPLPSAGVLRVTNNGTEVHEFIMHRFLPGKTLDDARGFYLAEAHGKTVPKPFTNAGGAVGLSPGQSNWLDLHLAPGTYVFFCFFPDPHKSGLPHALEGTLTVDTVT